MEKLLFLLKNNKGLNYIPKLEFSINSLSTEHIEPLMQALLGKKIGTLSFYKNKIDAEKIKILSKYLKNIDIKFLSIDSAQLGDKGASDLTKNLSSELEKLSLQGNDISKIGAIDIFKNLTETKVQEVHLNLNELCGNRLADDVIEFLQSSEYDIDRLISILNSASVNIYDFMAALNSPGKSEHQLKIKLEPLFSIKPDDFKEILASSSIKKIDLQFCGLDDKKSSFEGIENQANKKIKIDI